MEKSEKFELSTCISSSPDNMQTKMQTNEQANKFPKQCQLYI